MKGSIQRRSMLIAIVLSSVGFVVALWAGHRIAVAAAGLFYGATLTLAALYRLLGERDSDG